ncbi:protein downstream neighbor of son homolog isoform X1 [Apostichopus japonicus]|uniref:protein downstream neighbor of son homolog isoform X1 n=1 Tax=Stichopus japonicus TaxID=307972 RepID=UPI003AB55539
MSAVEEERHSPGWRRPSEVMKKRKKKKKVRDSVSDISMTRSKSTSSSPKRPGIVLKRRNPFGCGGAVSARRRIASDVGTKDSYDEKKEESEATDDAKFQAVQKTLSSLADDRKQEVINEDEGKSNHGNEAEKFFASDSEPPPSIQSSSCPIDWCLHTRVRFTSQASFEWSNRISSSEESCGITNFVLCKYQDQTSTQDESSLSEESIFRQRLKQSAMVWASPSLPWFKIFPRIVPESKDAKTSFIVNEDVAQKALMAQWCDSFCSVYQLLRSEMCPYFYICAHHLTILFRAKHISGHGSIHALLGPTTRGFRESLKAEGITFTMPLLKDDAVKYQDPHQVIEEVTKPQTQDSSALCKETNSGEEDLKPDEEEGVVDSDDVSWLESIGLENVLEIDSHREQMQTDPTVKQDNRPQSVLFVEGFANVQALYNFILNYKNIVSTVGLQAGIPPTILAPMAFHGATLTSNKIKSGCMRQIIGHQIHDIHTLEVSGPILPHNVHLLTDLLSETQQGQFSLTFQAHEPTACFTSASHTLFTAPTDDVSPNLKLDSFPRDFARRLFTPKDILQKSCKDMKFVNTMYEWT